MPVPFPGAYASAAEMAQQQLGALIGAARRGNRRETRAGQRFIRNLAHSFADELAAISGGIGNTYNMMERESAATNAALSNFLQGQGGQLSADLGEQLSYAGPDAMNAFAGGAERQAQSLARTAAAFGTQQTNRIVGEEASERAFGQSLPGIAALTGIQSARQYQGQQSRALQAQVDQLHSQQPGLTAELYNAFASQLLAQQEMAQQERFHNDEMAAQRAAAAGVKGGEGRERFDRISQGALEFMQGFIPQGIPGGPAPPPPNANEALSGLRSYWRKFYPGKSDEWISQQARLTMESYGVNDPSRMQGLREAMAPLPWTTRGKLLAGQYSPGASEGGGGRKPTPDSVHYDSFAQLQSLARDMGASPNRVHWEGPGFYRVSGGSIYKVG